MPVATRLGRRTPIQPSNTQRLLDRDFYRNGPDHRAGTDVGFAEVKRRFGLRTITIGRWVTKAEQAGTANHFYDALSDLQTLLHGPADLLSLRGTLSLTYGSGGQPGVSAHYEPATRTLALAKNAGPGSIAHEWFHALDHYLSDKAFKKATAGRFASAAWLADSPTIDHPLNRLLFDCFNTILLNETGNGTSEVFKQSVAADRSQNGLYFSLPEELAARAFEAFIQDSPLKNHFLVKGTKESPEAKLGLYPQGVERERINTAFNTYFQALGTALMRQGIGPNTR
ncbi:CLCA_X family protein [Saccharospirillum impatiens]|uniref:CLCA_X family protein n=1 Tax=Saccharospirillum impatiens TaxID=169438 RepID=UPI0003FCC432|nr:CLCA_X family protein [Saccharospirillum impatiens]